MNFFNYSSKHDEAQLVTLLINKIETRKTFGIVGKTKNLEIVKNFHLYNNFKVRCT